MAETGLRERKKRRTRELIAGEAQRLFIAHGFDAVTVDDIAIAADVARKTVFNYFSTKEDLFFSSVERIESGLLAALEERPLGQSVVAAFYRWITNLRWEWGVVPDDPGAYEHLRSLSRVIAETPSLEARERQIYDHYTNAVAALIAEELKASDHGDANDTVPWVLANALVGVFRALNDYARRRVLAGDQPTKIASGLRAETIRALAQLQRAL